MHRQADDIADDRLIFSQLLEELRFGRQAAARVVFERTGKRLPCGGDRHADSHRAVVHTCQASHSRQRPCALCFGFLVHKNSVQPSSRSRCTTLRIDSSSCLLATSVASGVCTTMQSFLPTVTTRCPSAARTTLAFVSKPRCRPTIVLPCSSLTPSRAIACQLPTSSHVNGAST